MNKVELKFLIPKPNETKNVITISYGGGGVSPKNQIRIVSSARILGLKIWSSDT